MDYEFNSWLWLALDVLCMILLAGVIFATYRSYQNRFETPTALERSRKRHEERHRMVGEGR